MSVTPAAIEPAAFERLAVRVANPGPSAVVVVRLDVPTALSVLGVDAPPGWAWRVEPSTDSTPRAIVWSGDSLGAGAFREFALLVRLAGDARQRTLLLPLRLQHADGRTVTWTRGGDAPAPVVRIGATTAVSVRGAVALGGGALGLAALAVVLALHRRTG